MSAPSVVWYEPIAPALGSDLELACPVCGSSYLHQARVEVYERGEDNPEVQRTRVEAGATAEVVAPLPLQLVVYQHKGRTYVEWQGARS